MPINDVYESVFSWQIGSVPTLNVCHFLVEQDFVAEAPFSPPTEMLARTLHQSAWLDALLTLVSEEVELLSIYTRKVAPNQVEIPFLYVVGATAPNFGSAVGTPIAPQVAMLISLYGQSNNRNERGRMYVPGFPEGQETEGQIDAALLGAAQAFCDLAKEVIDISYSGTGQVKQCVYSRSTQLGKAVTFAVPRTNLATIRGRRARPGIS
jgi:hypothetical protein